MLTLLILIPYYAWTVRYRCGKHSIEIDASTVYVQNSIVLVLKCQATQPQAPLAQRQYMQTFIKARYLVT